MRCAREFKVSARHSSTASRRPNTLQHCDGVGGEEGLGSRGAGASGFVGSFGKWERGSMSQRGGGHVHRRVVPHFIFMKLALQV